MAHGAGLDRNSYLVKIFSICNLKWSYNEILSNRHTYPEADISRREYFFWNDWAMMRARESISICIFQNDHLPKPSPIISGSAYFASMTCSRILASSFVISISLAALSHWRWRHHGRRGIRAFCFYIFISLIGKRIWYWNVSSLTIAISRGTWSRLMSSRRALILIPALLASQAPFSFQIRRNILLSRNTGQRHAQQAICCMAP